MSSFPCPRCKEPVSFEDKKCWHCGWNTASYEESYERMKPVEATFVKLNEPYEPFFIEVELPNKLTGLSSSYYELPNGCKELQDLIEYKNMNFARGNIFKATYRLGDKPGTDQIYDYEKIIWFAQREIERLKNAEKSAD